MQTGFCMTQNYKNRTILIFVLTKNMKMCEKHYFCLIYSLGHFEVSVLCPHSGVKIQKNVKIKHLYLYKKRRNIEKHFWYAKILRIRLAPQID